MDYPLDRRLNGSQTRSGHYGKQANLLLLPEIKPLLLGIPDLSQFTILTDNLVVSPAALGPENDCAGEAQQ
jgi:hypothetical protein